MTSNNKISTLFPNQVPFFIREDYPDAVVFFQKYYEFLEQSNVDFRSGYPIERLITHLQTIDIDNTDHDEAAEYLYKKFIQDIPLSIEADKSILLKHIKDFYRAKGTEKATKFLIYALTGHANTSLYYPKQDILKTSDGKWFIQKTLRIANTWINGSSDSSLEGLQLFLGQQIIGETSNASAIVETTNRFYEQGSLIDELVLSNIQGDFQNGEKILSNDGYETHLYGGVLNTITIRNGGVGYNVGDPVIVVSNTGTGACVVVSGVSTGNISSMLVDYGGAGFQRNDQIHISGGGGSGANAIVYIVDNSGSVHPNSYNIVAATIGLEGNTIIGNTLFSNLVPAVSDPANSSIANSMLYFQYSNVGPIRLVYIVNSGTNYTSAPTGADVVSNTIVRNSGILGRMSLNNGGVGYHAGDEIEFINVIGGYGTGALGNVTSVDGSGVITGIAFKQMAGHYIGGSGYNQGFLPRANVVSTTGSGANVTVTAILGDGEIFGQTGITPIGSIEEITIINKGVNYDDTTTLDLTNSGDGNANATLTIIEGLYSFPGRFLNDDGFLSAYNFLQDQHYYQPYSYVIRTDVPMSEYTTTMKKLGHPSGLKMFGEYINKDQTDSISYDIENSESVRFIGDTLVSDFYKISNVVNVVSSGHSLYNGNTVYIEIIDWNGTANQPFSNGMYNITTTNPNFFHFSTPLTENANGNVIISVQNYRPYNTVSYIKTANTIVINKTNHGMSNGQNIHYRTVDFTQTKKNILTQTEFQYGKSGNTYFSSPSYFLEQSNVMSNVFAGGTTGLMHLANNTTVNTTFGITFSENVALNSWVTFSCYVQMMDGAPPTVGFGGNKTMYLFYPGVGAVTTNTVTLISNSIYRITGTKYMTANAVPACINIYKYRSDVGINDNRAFIITGCQLEYGNIATDYETVANSWIAANTYITPNGVYSITTLDTNSFSINTPKQNNAVGNAKIRIV